jgi:putative membrane protein
MLRERGLTMRNVLRIIRDDIRHAFSNVMSTIIMVGLIVLPSLFAWYNILACWNVFDNTGNLTVAVASADEGYQSDLVPIRINVGEQVMSALRENDQIDWVFTNEEDAVDGAKSGRYYAAVVIPESFSQDMLTFYAEDATHAKIYYYVNEKKNAIAPRITERSADTVSYQINEVFAETISTIALGLAQAVETYVDEGDVNGKVAQLADHLRRVSSRMDEAAQVLQMYAALADESQGLVQGSSTLIDATRGNVSDIAGKVQSGQQNLSGLADAIRSSADDLEAALAANDSQLAQLQGDVESTLGDASVDAQTCADGLRAQADALDVRIQEYQSVLDALQSLRASIPDEHAQTIDGAISSLNETLGILQDVSAALRNAASNLESGDADMQGRLEEISQIAGQARSDVDATRADFEQNVRPSMQQLADDVAAFSDNLDVTMSDLDVIGDDLSGSVDSAGQALGRSSGKVDDTASSLQEASSDLQSLADDIDAALASGDSDALRKVLGSDASSLANTLAAPVKVERIAVFPSENFGSAMAPLYTTLALFIGALLIMVAVKPTVSPRGRENLVNPKPRQLFFGRFGVVAVLSLLQSTLMGLGNMLFLQVQVVHPLLFMLCYWFSGLVFAFIIYVLVVSFANLGKAFAVLLLIIQVTGCGGSYPLQILPQFVQDVSPFLPATHVVNAMRGAMMGVYGNDFWASMGDLALFIVPMLLLGLVLRKPLERFMFFYISKVEDSKLVE